MIKQIKSIIEKDRKQYEKMIEKQENLTEYKCDNDKKLQRKYRNIPLYTDKEMKNAVVDDSDEVTKECVGRQAINGYVGLYKNKYIVGRRRDGSIVKTCEPLIFDALYSKEKRMGLILKVQNRALLGEDLENEIFCKFTYDLENQHIFASHVTLNRDYVENEVMEDSGTYGGLHFVSFENIDACADIRDTYYGNKIALIKTIKGEVYYEYKEDTFVGNKVYVKKVMHLKDVETWQYLSERFTSIREHKEALCRYLHELNELIPDENYMASIKFVEKL